MAFELQEDTADQLTRWANSAGGRGGPRGFNSQPIEVPDLQAIQASWDAPLPPPQRIDFAAIAADANSWANTTFGHLSTPEFKQEVASYWGVPSAPAAPVAASPSPSFMQGPTASEPQVYYGAPAPAEQGVTMPASLTGSTFTPPFAPATPSAPAVSMGALNRAETYAQQSLGGAFNGGAAKPLSHMAGFAGGTTPPTTKRPGGLQNS